MDGFWVLFFFLKILTLNWSICLGSSILATHCHVCSGNCLLRVVRYYHLMIKELWMKNKPAGLSLKMLYTTDSFDIILKKKSQLLHVITGRSPELTGLLMCGEMKHTHVCRIEAVCWLVCPKAS